MLLVALVSQATGLHSGTVDFDTPWLVVDNPILSTGSLSALPAILWSMDTGTRLTLGAEYLPVRDLTVLLDFALFGEAWLGHHLQSLAWYLLGCWLFHRVCLGLLGDGPRALLAALLFAAHPVHVESVVWLASRKDVVSLALFMGALVCWQRRGEHRLLAPLTGLLALLAYWAKNTAVVLPAWLLALELLAPPGERSLRRLLDLAWPGLAVVAGLTLTLSLGEAVGMYAEPRADTLAGFVQLDLVIVARYLGMLAWPLHLAPLYAEPTVQPWTEPGVLASAALVLGTLGVGLACWRRAPLVALGTAWFVLALVPVLQLVPIQNLMAVRYLLLPSAGAALALCAVPLPARARAPALVAGLVAAGLLTVLSLRENLVWRDSVSLWSRAVAVQPQLPRAWASLAAAQTSAGQHDAAGKTLARGLALHPEAALLHQTRGLRAVEADDDVLAERSYRTALRLDPTLRRSSHNLTLLLLKQGRVEEAVAQGAATARDHALWAPGHVSYGVALMEQGELQQAAVVFLRAAELDPHLAAPHCNLGGVAFLGGDLGAAELGWQRCLELDPANEQAQRGLDEVERRRAAAPRGAP